MPRTRRGRTLTEEVEELTGGDTSRLTEVLTRLALQTATPRKEFKLPRYDGKSDVELFIQQFTEIGEANNWERPAALLHLKEALVDTARDCSRPTTVEGVLAALRSRFGLTVREARAKLTIMRRDYNTPLQEHSVEIERLVDIAYSDLNHRQKQEMTLDLFATTLGHVQLQRHLLAVAPADLTQMVKAGNEYLQLQSSHPRGGRQHAVQALESDEGETMDRQHVAPVNAPHVDTQSALVEMMKVLQQIAGRLDNSRSYVRPRQNDGKEPRPPPTCWGCGQVGHLKRACKQPASSQHSQTGNDSRPQV